MVGATSAATWTALNNQFTRTGVSAVYQDFKAATKVKIGLNNPAKDITRLSTHLEPDWEKPVYIGPVLDICQL